MAHALAMPGTDLAPFARLAPVALNAGGGEAGPPDWVELVPAGAVVGRDGRVWRNDEPDAVILAFQQNGAPLPIDWEHASEHKAPKGEPAPAAAWIVELASRAGAIWGRVEWTDAAAQQVVGRAYRYLSPVFLYDRTTRRIAALRSAGLTNQPNLHLTALNQAHHGGEMEFSEAIRQALGVSADASETDVLAAANRRSQDLPSLDKYVPRADYDQALNRAQAAETRLAEVEASRRDAEVETAIRTALEAGKITPATADYHRAQCRSEGGLARFQAFVAAAPAVGAASGLEGKRPPASDTALNAETLAVARQMGVSIEDIRTHGLVEEG